MRSLKAELRRSQSSIRQVPVDAANKGYSKEVCQAKAHICQDIDGGASLWLATKHDARYYYPTGPVQTVKTSITLCRYCVQSSQPIIIALKIAARDLGTSSII